MPSEPLPIEPLAPRKKVSAWIKVFVVLHIIAITSWAMPGAPPNLVNGKEQLGIDRSSPQHFLQSVGRDISDGTLLVNQNYGKNSPLKFYLLFTGFWQYWDMFSPNPSSIDFYGSASITYRNGTKSLYTFPRMYTMGIPQKYVSERYRKFYERAHLEKNSWLWPTFAQRVALINDTDPNNPPVQVVLTRHWMVVAEPGKPQQKDYHSYDYYTYMVDQNKLDEAKAAGPLG
jgi:hypothetical protein